MKTAIFALAAAASGAAVGAFLGLVGSLLPEGLRVAGLLLAAAVLSFVALFDWLGVRVRLVEWDRETPQSWLDLGTVGWSLLNGAALGVGFLSRLGFHLSYAVPLASIGAGDPVVGAWIFGLYAGLRGLLALPFLLLMGRGGERFDVAELVMDLKPAASRLASYSLLTVSVLTVVASGLGG